MPQIFHERFGLLLRVVLLAGLVLVAIGIAAWRAATGAPHAIGDAVEQPVPFSHEHHVGEVGLDCRYCHADVETSANAGLPPVSTCMTCHSSLFADAPLLAPVRAAAEGSATLAWNRVNDLPDFVYFDHSVHVDVGVACVVCHGRVDTMPLVSRTRSLSMRWCLDCHRAPEKYLRARSQIFAAGDLPKQSLSIGRALAERHRIDTRRLTDCSTCHR